MQHLTYPRVIPAPEIIGRLLGPDALNAFSQAIDARYLDDGRTRITCRPVAPGELTHMYLDDCGQWWLPLPGQAQVSSRVS